MNMGAATLAVFGAATIGVGLSTSPKNLTIDEATLRGRGIRAPMVHGEPDPDTRSLGNMYGKRRTPRVEVDWHPFRRPDMQGAVGYLSFKSPHGDRNRTYPRRSITANDVVLSYKSFCVDVGTPDVLQIDGATAAVSTNEAHDTAFELECAKNYTRLSISARKHPEQNIGAEKHGRDIAEHAIGAVEWAGLDINDWASFAVQFYTYIGNIVPVKSLNWHTRYYMSTGKKPPVAHLQVPFCPVLIQQSKPLRQAENVGSGDYSGFVKRTHRGVFVGYPTYKKIGTYSCYDFETRTFIETPDVYFDNDFALVTRRTDKNGWDWKLDEFIDPELQRHIVTHMTSTVALDAALGAEADSAAMPAATVAERRAAIIVAHLALSDDPPAPVAAPVLRPDTPPPPPGAALPTPPRPDRPPPPPPLPPPRQGRSGGPPPAAAAPTSAAEARRLAMSSVTLDHDPWLAAAMRGPADWRAGLRYENAVGSVDRAAALDLFDGAEYLEFVEEALGCGESELSYRACRAVMEPAVMEPCSPTSGVGRACGVDAARDIADDADARAFDDFAGDFFGSAEIAGFACRAAPTSEPLPDGMPSASFAHEHEPPTTRWMKDNSLEFLGGRLRPAPLAHMPNERQRADVHPDAAPTPWSEVGEGAINWSHMERGWGEFATKAGVNHAKNAFIDELAGIYGAGCVCNIELPPGEKAIRTRMVTKVKSDGRAKCRAVVRAFLQKVGAELSEHEVSSPVALRMSQRACDIIAVKRAILLDLVDVKLAFIHGKLYKLYYVYPPPGLDLGFGPNGRPIVWLLFGSLYGLREAPQIWYCAYGNWLIDQGYYPIRSDPATFIHATSPDLRIITVHVDDSKLIFDDSAERMKFKQALVAENGIARSGISDLGIDFGSCCGIEYERTSIGYRLRIEKFIESVAERFGLVGSSKAKEQAPLPDRIDPRLDMPEGVEVDSAQRLEFWKMVGCLRWATDTGVRTEFAFAAGFLGAHRQAPVQYDMQLARHALKYMIATKSDYTALELSPDLPSGFKTEADVDANWGGCKRTLRSHWGGRITWGGLPLMTRCARIKELSSSSTVAEIQGMSELCRDIVLHLHIVAELRHPPTEPALLRADNYPAIRTSEQQIMLTDVSRTVALRYVYVRELVGRGLVTIRWVASARNVADVFTKSLTALKFVAFKAVIMGWNLKWDFYLRA